jgi:hypothetical protein
LSSAAFRTALAVGQGAASGTDDTIEERVSCRLLILSYSWFDFSRGNQSFNLFIIRSSEEPFLEPAVSNKMDFDKDRFLIPALLPPKTTIKVYNNPQLF